MGEFAGGLDFAEEHVCDACAFAAGEPCDYECVGGIDERGDGERAAGNQYNYDFVACGFPGFDLLDVGFGCSKGDLAVGLVDDFVVEVLAAEIAEPFGVRNFSDNIDDGACFFGGGDACAVCDFVKSSLD